MKTSSFQGRGFTLLEMMIASALGVVVITTGLVVGTQMQKRALFEEQTMTAQVTGRTVKDVLVADVWRAGVGMGNTPIAFDVDDERSAITVWHRADLTADATFVQAPTAALASDALQLYWGETNGAITLASCPGGDFRNGNTFCALPEAPTALVTPSGPTLAVMASGGRRMACPVNITAVAPGAPGSMSTITTDGADKNPACIDGAAAWSGPTGLAIDVVNWMAMRLGGVAYRVNWRNNIPTLEYRPVGEANWLPLSRDVEQLTVREGLIDFNNPDNALQWFPNEGMLPVPAQAHPAISECTLAKYDTNECSLGLLEADGSAVVKPPNDLDLRKRLRQRVRQLEVTLVIRTRRSNQEAIQPGLDEEGFVRDGYSRRRFTFTVEPRNFMSVGMVRVAGAGGAAP
ncbi:prepilin-type N-terminal cleavage/methylation domain-containing protein [Corallococcus sp. AB018]|uniref:PilW family protein n=1 Tax=Corallococcus TaxID=83461 RepID=UPI000EA3B58C|nr:MULTISPECIES: prepilin-type N-terminal cleavage/methylation domain-containing protein [Corallococcus]NRD52868.1 prepilin-type N-terminal cleavage/methylation domain-containing protein [Corallococcus exiguus]RKH31122.1 prepilin-type N-terminal cleavage/methylation domain-containing protein [Corallococcus sp. CA041A]RUO93304.1 prepilin-type N-terminal cleavage/methylation domain-containing protein [Corallococcus sp. AB018]